MPIINKGILDIATVSLRQTGNDWPTAQVTYTSDVVEVSSNLYFTNARVISSLVQSNVYVQNLIANDTLFANALILQNINVTSNIITGTVSSGTTTSNIIVADSVTSNTWNRLYSSNVVENTNLYFTNARVVSALIAGQNITIEANGRISANASSGASLNLTTADVRETSNLYFTNARVVTVVTPLLTTANVVETSGNLYFTNTRARAAFTAGRGIILMSDGTIKSSIGTETFSTAIDGGRSYSITTSMNGLTFTSQNAADRLILRSLHITNVSDNTAYVSSNVLYAGGNTAYLGSLIPVPVGGIAEFMDRPQIIQPGDTINLQAFNQNQTPANGVLQAYFTYETITSDTTYVGTGQTLATSNANILLVTADQSDTIFESIKFVNLQSYSIPIKTFFGDANGLPKAYLAYNLQIPSNSSVEILQSPKLLKYLDTLYVSYANASNGNAIAVFPSYRRTAVTTPFASTSSAVAQGSIQAAFTTTVIDGSTLYYTLE
jgi:hypothetical protein